MKALVKLGAMAVVASGLLTSAFAGSWAHAQTSPGSWSGSITTTAATFVSQYAGNCFDYIINDGPAGNYTLSPGQSLDKDANVAAGTYSVYQAVGPKGGYSCITMSW